MNIGDRKRTQKEVKQYWDDLVEHYQHPPEMPENVKLCYDSILQAKDLDEVAAIAERCQQKMQVMVLGAWARKRIPGPKTEANLEKQAKSAEGLAKMLEGKGHAAAAERQRERAAALAKEADLARQQKKEA